MILGDKSLSAESWRFGMLMRSLVSNAFEHSSAKGMPLYFTAEFG